VDKNAPKFKMSSLNSDYFHGKCPRGCLL